MTLMTVDVVTLCPPEARQEALRLSDLLGRRMSEAGTRSAFQLGRSHPGEPDGICEPHVSVFMLAVDESEMSLVLAAVSRVAEEVAAFSAKATHYTHNPFGAPELFFHKSQEWYELQRATLRWVEPLRRGRLRSHDPAGREIAGLISAGSDPEQVRQLQAYGYDEITDDRADRFNPHITLAWPVTPVRVDLGDLPVSVFDHAVDEVVVTTMNTHGTCTRIHGRFALRR